MGRKLPLAVLVSIAAAAQNPVARPEFEVASIRPSAPGNPESLNVGVHIDGAMVRCNSLSLRDYVGLAYGVKAYQIVGPDWFPSVKFDISAKLPDGASRKQVPEMMQALLADRFKLAFHRDSKEFSVYALVLGKGPLKLKPSPPDAAPAVGEPNVDVTVSGGGRAGAVVNLGQGATISSAMGHLEAKRVPMRQLADSVSNYLDRPVVDMTGLAGIYDVSLQYSLEELRSLLRSTGASQFRTIPDSAADQFPGSLSDSLQALGLKLEARKAPLEVLVIERAERTPTQN
jgi:uncharacterized protein (TIGR03435 family)